MQNDEKITIKFELTNEFGDHYSQELSDFLDNYRADKGDCAHDD